MIWNALSMALKQIGRNLVRAGLTTLGILIGVGAVIAIVTLGRGATARVNADLAGLGRNLLFVIPGADSNGGGNAASTRPFVAADATALEQAIPNLAAVAPTVSTVTMAVAGGAQWRTTITGTDDAYLSVLNWDVDLGRSFSEGELRSGSAVCVLGDTVRRQLFGSQDPIGATLRASGISLRVVGVLTPKGTSTFGQDQDDFFLIPLLTFQRRISGERYVGALFASARAGAATEHVQQDIVAVMRQRRHIQPGQEADFHVHDMKEITAMLDSISGVLTSFLAAIAAVSLVVGGIGIMNIMLVSVTERTREIGIRLAIGARTRDVLLQFLVEAVALATLGGLLGIVFGLGGSYLLTQQLKLPFVLDLGTVLLAFAVSALVGITFGFFPALKAARLDPIDALRHE